MITRLAHVEVGVTDLDAAHDFYAGLLGFNPEIRTDEALYLRAADEYDRWSLKLTKSDGPGLLSFGMRVDDEGDLERLAALHEELEYRHTALPADFEPARGEGLRVQSPEGFVIDFHHRIGETELHDEQGRISPPMRRREAQMGVPPIEIDHVNMRVADMQRSVDYLTGRLNFSISEGVKADDGTLIAAWMRRSRSTHDVALLPNPEPGMHHFAYLLPGPSNLIRAMDILADAGYAGSVQFGPGRHGVGGALTMYFLDPDGNRIELYTTDTHRDLDREPIFWTESDYMERGRFWWGAPPTEGFRIATPYLEPKWPSEVAAGSQAS